MTPADLDFLEKYLQCGQPIPAAPYTIEEARTRFELTVQGMELELEAISRLNGGNTRLPDWVWQNAMLRQLHLVKIAKELSTHPLLDLSLIRAYRATVQS